MSKEKYSIRIEVRHLDGGAIYDANKRVKEDDVFDLDFSRENAERVLKDVASVCKITNPNRKINVSAYLFNSISRTYMEMFSFYSNEDRFISY